jgi:SAM-dependent methyltransferase
MSFTERFTSRAAVYALARPSYPAAAIDALIAGLGDPASLVVADLGAGTGLSSRAIAARGPRVLAVEPNAAMRENALRDERVGWIAGTAEATTLADASVDAVAAFQAWHWVDQDAAVAEARRILRPGGRLAAVYNEHDLDDRFTAAYASIFSRFSTRDVEGRRAHGLDGFTAIAPAHVRRSAFANPFVLDREGAHAHARSQSFLPQAGAAADDMHAFIDELVTAYQRDGRVTLQFVTVVAALPVAALAPQGEPG